MCLIAIVQDEEHRPSRTMIDKAWNENPHGGGIAWREGEGKNAVVRWKKGLDLIEMQQMIKDLPMPFIPHFRKKSVGEITKTMCHPFEVSLDASLELEGETKGYVFFHNGTWQKWDDFTLDTAMKSGAKLPDGKWSDTRAMAWLSSVLGFGFLEIIGAKGIAFSPTKVKVFEGNGWFKHEGIWVSNLLFDTAKNGYYELGKHHQGHGGWKGAESDRVARPPIKDEIKTVRIYCRWERCTTKDGLDAAGFCKEHAATGDSKKKTSIARDGKKDSDSVVNGNHTVETFGNIVRKHPKNKPSPCQKVVDAAREVAKTSGPFAALEFIKRKYLMDDLSNSQLKKLTKEFNDMGWKRTKRQKELEQTFRGQVLPAD